MRVMEPLDPASVVRYLESRPASVRWPEWLRGRRYRITRLGEGFRNDESRNFASPSRPLVVIAHPWGDREVAARAARALGEDWALAPPACQEAYSAILARAPQIVVIDLRRHNRCGCLGHRHPVVREAPFAEPHEALGGGSVGEVDIAWKRVQSWPALPLQETALDARFFVGTRLDEFRQRQFRLRLLSVFLHETHHLVNPEAPEEAVRERSLAFYRDALASYAEETCATLAFTIDRSFSRME